MTDSMGRGSVQTGEKPTLFCPLLRTRIFFHFRGAAELPEARSGRILWFLAGTTIT